MVEYLRLFSELRDEVITPPTNALFWLQTPSFFLTKAFNFESFLFVLLEPFSCDETNTILLSTMVIHLKLFFSTLGLLFCRISCFDIKLFGNSFGDLK